MAAGGPAPQTTDAGPGKEKATGGQAVSTREVCLKPKTIDAQRVKRALVFASKKIGRRKRLRAGAFFELIVDAMNAVN